ncbi:hypothetical protein SCP_0402830 [Sparassis crispa]|uniref:Uncharacterized protein n=1 Tax=Sparassis crispa TaxID=139825 RepID=A0A401GIB2_9APHY|nr:hypothetical protein SCP_0402830 [Sparassis crispa]GBE81909.1 hypothetical protein SCP_0402830 [Sparassis crispa]
MAVSRILVYAWIQARNASPRRCRSTGTAHTWHAETMSPVDPCVLLTSPTPQPEKAYIWLGSRKSRRGRMQAHSKSLDTYPKVVVFTSSARKNRQHGRQRYYSFPQGPQEARYHHSNTSPGR